MLKKGDYIQHAPLVVIDCSKQNKSLKQAPDDVLFEFEAKENYPAQTSAYYLILHDCIIKCNPMSGNIRKLVYRYWCHLQEKIVFNVYFNANII